MRRNRLVTAGRGTKARVLRVAAVGRAKASPVRSA